MNEPGPAVAPPALPDGHDARLAALEALRNTGAARLDPVRWRYIEVLAQRLPAQPPAVQRLLEGKLQQALDELDARLRIAPEAAHAPAVQRPRAAPAPAGPGRTCAPLAALNQYLRDATQPPPAAHLDGDAPHGSELRSVHGFRQTWSRISAEKQVTQAVGRGPENAGPLNSHMLMLRSLALMRDLSPDYLRRFLSQAETLLWLEQASRQAKPAAAKSARRARVKK